MAFHRMPNTWRLDLLDFATRHIDAFGIYEFTPRNHRHFFRFDIQPVGAVSRVFIVSQPDYGPRAADLLTTHRAKNPDGRIYVDIHPDQEPWEVPEALAWALLWAEQTSVYIDSGRLMDGVITHHSVRWARSQ